MLRPAPPEAIVRTDTVTVTREVAPPLPAGDTVELCLSNGMTVKVLVTAEHDTLVGDARASLRQLRPVLSFAGAYAAEQSWFSADTVRLENRLYRKAGAERAFTCDELKEVGSYQGVPVFARVEEMSDLPYIVLPVRAGIFQPYTTPQTTRRRR